MALLPWCAGGDYLPGEFVLAQPPSMLEETRLLSGGSASASSGSASGASGGGGTHHSGAFTPMLMLLVVYTASAMCQSATALLPAHIRPPHSVVLYLFGVLLARVSRYLENTDLDGEFTEAVKNFMDVDPHVIFWVFLPALLYEDASSLQWHVVRRVIPSALLLAFPGVIINVVLTGTLARYCCQEFGFETALLLGSILSATDPVAVVGALNALQAPAKLSSLISGESLFNDGSAVAVFFIFKDIVAGTEEFDLGNAILKMLRLSLGGVFLGVVVSCVAYIWIAKTKSFNVEIIIVTVCIYGLFFMAEHHVISASGVLAVVTFGFFMCSVGRFSIDVEKEHEYHTIIGYLALMSNEAIFMLAGIVGYAFTFIHEEAEHIGSVRDYIDLAILYAGIHVTRALVIAMFSPFLTHMGYGLDWKEATICVFGGLRGAVGLAMALLVSGDNNISSDVRARIAFHVNGIVILTLFINGTTITALYNKLRIVDPGIKQQHDRLVADALRNLDSLTKKQAECYKHHWYFGKCDVDLVLKLVPNFSDHFDNHFKDLFGRRQMGASTDHSVQDTMQELADNIKRRHLGDPDESVARAFQRVVLAKHAEAKDFNVFASDMAAVADSEADQAMRTENINLALLDVKTEIAIGALKVDSLIERAAQDEGNPLLSQRLHGFLAAGGSGRGTPLSGGTARSRAGSDTSTPKKLEDSCPPDAAKKKVSFGSAEGQLAKTANEKIAEGAPLELSEIVTTEKCPVKPVTTAAQRARRNWTRGYCLVKEVNRRLKEAKDSPDDVSRKTTSSAMRVFDKYSAYRQSSGASSGMKALQEVIQITLNSIRAESTVAFETRSLAQGPYEIIVGAVEHAEDALHGDLDVTSHRVKMADLGAAIAAGTKDQPNFALQVMFKIVMSYVGKPSTPFLKLQNLFLCNRKSLVAAWSLIKRDVSLLCAFSFILAHTTEELKDMRAFDESLADESDGYVQQARRGLIDIAVREPALGVFYEHLFLANLLMRTQASLIHKMQEEGSLTERDAHHLKSEVLGKYEEKVLHFQPTPELLRRAGAQECFENSRKMDRLLQFIHVIIRHDM